MVPTHAGGTNLRVCLVTLQGDGKFEITQTKYRLTEEQKQDDGQKLFDFCAECLQTFIESNTGDGPGELKPGQPLPLGFTVCYTLITKCTDLTWRQIVVLVSLLVSICEFEIFVILSEFLRQDRIDHGELIRWTKGFGAPNTEGQDVAGMLRKSLEKYVRPFTTFRGCSYV